MLNEEKSRYGGKTILIIIMLIGTALAQTIYEIQPGTKGNEIVLTVANVSEENPATNISIKPHPTPCLAVRQVSKGEDLNNALITFHQSEQTIDILNPKEEKEVSFTFDVSRSAQINKKDTIEFMITDEKRIMMAKRFIFSYIGPKEFKLEQNYPNPFNPTTKIRYQIPDVGTGLAQSVLKVYDILGNEVATLVNEQKEPGYYEVEFSASQFASGVYIYRLKTTFGYSEVKKMLLLK